MKLTDDEEKALAWEEKLSEVLRANNFVPNFSNRRILEIGIKVGQKAEQNRTEPANGECLIKIKSADWDAIVTFLTVHGWKEKKIPSPAQPAKLAHSQDMEG